MDNIKYNKDTSDKSDYSPYTGEISFHPIRITTLIIKNGLIVGYTQK